MECREPRPRATWVLLVARRRKGTRARSPRPRAVRAQSYAGESPMPAFKLDTVYSPTADQPKAIDQLAEGIANKERFTTLLGATGTGKTMTMAGVIERLNRPALVMAHNKTLAA